MCSYHVNNVWYECIFKYERIVLCWNHYITLIQSLIPKSSQNKAKNPKSGLVYPSWQLTIIYVCKIVQLMHPICKCMMFKWVGFFLCVVWFFESMRVLQYFRTVSYLKFRNKIIQKLLFRWMMWPMNILFRVFFLSFECICAKLNLVFKY